MSAVRVLLLLSFLLSSLSALGSTVVTMLVDVDRDAATGCAVSGMTGVEASVMVRVDETVVTSIATRRCVAGSMLPSETTPAGWPALRTDQQRDVELSVLFASIGATPGSPLRVGFLLDDEGRRTTLFHGPAGEPIVLDIHGSRRRAARPAAGGAVPVIDGNVEEWTYLKELAAGGPLSVWLHPVGDRLFIRFAIRGTTSQSPVAMPDSYEAREARPLSVPAPGVLTNDFDPGDLPLTAIAVVPPQSGSLTLSPDGGFVYVHDGSSELVDAFQYRVSNGTLESEVATATLHIAPNQHPVATDDAYALTDGSVSVTAPGVLANDTDGDGDALEATLTTPPLHGTLTLDPDGSLTYVSNLTPPQDDSFTYQAFDGVFVSNPATVSLARGNASPVAADDGYTTNEDVALSVPVPGLLQNDTDADGDPLTVEILSNPASGTLVALPDGSFDYAPNLDFSGVDGFDYRVSDGRATSAAAHVTITVAPVNDPPVATPDAATVAEGGTVAIDVLANDADPDDSTFTVTVVTIPANGTVTVNPDGSITYVHDGSETTVDSFSYTIHDGDATSNVALVSITVTPVNDAPVAANDTAAVDEGAATTIDVLANDSDAEGSALTPALVANPAHGTAVVNPDGTITYTHDGSETTSDQFTYQATDGQASSDVVTVTITINPVNDAPVAVDDEATVAEGGTVSIAILMNDSDADDASFTATILTTPGSGTATLEADGTVTYVHDGGESASDSFTYSITDGLAISNVATVTLTISPVNDVPVANADAATLDEGTSVTLDVTANDTDAEGDTLTPQIVATPARGTAVVNGDGTITYTHDGSETTADTFSYRVTDGTDISNTATVTLAITPVNDAPVAVGDSATVDENGSIAIAVQANDSDAEGDSLTTVIIDGPAHGTATVVGGTVVDYVHDGSETTSDSFTYRVNDGLADSNTITVTITINPINDAPVANDDSVTVDEAGSIDIDVLANDSDAENETLTLTVLSAPGHGTATVVAGRITYVHNGSETTSDSFTYSVSDPDGASDSATVTITVTPINDAPVATDDSASVIENGTTTIDVLVNDSDAEGSTLTPSVVTPPAHGTAVVNGDGTITYTNNGDEVNADSFTYRVNDGDGDSNVATVSITITLTNDAPIAVADTATVAEGGSVTIPVLANDSDAEGEALTVVLDSATVNGSLTLNPDNTVTYAHDGGETSADTFTYHVVDASMAVSATVTVSITVTPVNDAPFAIDDAYDYPTDGSSLVVAAPGVLANDGDVDSPSITAVLDSPPAEGTLVLNADGSFEYTKDPLGTLTTLTFSYHAFDGTAASALATVTLTLNTAPVATDDSFTVLEDNILEVAGPGLLANDTDAQNNITKVILVSGPNCLGYPANGCGMFPGLFPPDEDALQEDGSFRYMPPAHFAGTVTFTYKLEDGGGLESSVVTATITVTPVNDPPQFDVSVFTVTVPMGQLYKRTGVVDLIQPGPNEAADEAMQVVNFVATPQNGSLFKYFLDFDIGYVGSGVHLDQSGTLWINPNAVGSTTLEIVAVDDGGTDNGGNPTSDPVFITVNVVSSNAPPTFTVLAGHTVAEDSGAASRAGFVTSISAPESTQTVTMSIQNNDNPGLFSAGPSLTGSGSSRTLTFTPAPNAFGVATLTIRAQDNGSPVQFTDKTATITITAVNDPPTFTKGSDLQYGTGVTGLQTIGGWATAISAGPNETGQVLTFNVTVRTGASVFAVAPAINPADGTLTFNLNGTPGLATIDVTLSDNGGGTNTSATQTFLIAAGGVNTPPRFVKGSNVTVLEDSGPQTFAGWATSIDDGDPAATQNVSFLVANSNNALFSIQPAIAPNGTLTFTPAANAFGAATVTVRAQDDGGTANGGVDTSDLQTFTLTITDVNDQPSLSLTQSTITRGENGGVQTFAGFAIANPGPNETGQTFTYTVTQSAGDPLFTGGGASAPAISSAGTLTFQTAIDAIGSATFSVVVKDNGGAANGGIDTSASQSFTITITDGNVTIPPANIVIEAYPNIPISITNDASDASYRLLEGVTVPAGKGPATVLVTTKPANSLVTVDDPLTGAFTFRSGTLSYSAGAVQPQSFKFRACDIDGNCSPERTVVVNFGTRPLIFFIDDSSSQSPGLHTFDVPGRNMHTGFTHTSPAPAATYIVMSGNYTNGTTTSPINTRIRAGDQVLGQGLAGLTFASLGVVDLPVGSLPALPDLSTGTTPRLHMPDPYDTSGGGIQIHEGSFFLGYGGGTVKNLRLSKERDHMNSWVMLSRANFTTLGGDYLFDQITVDNGQSFAIGQTNPGSVTIRNSTLNISEGFASNNGTWLIENTVINLNRTDGSRTALFYNFSSPGVVNQSYTIDAASSVTLHPFADLFSTNAAVGSFRIDAPLTITRIGSVNGLVINDITSIELNGKVDVTTAGGKPLVVSNVGSFAMPNAANEFTMTASLAGFGSVLSMAHVNVGAAGVMLSNLSLDGGNLSFIDTGGGTITVASGSVVGNGIQDCVDRDTAPNVVVNPAVVFTDCNP